MSDEITFDVSHLIAAGRGGDLAISPCGLWAAVSVQHLDAKEAKYVSSLWRVELSETGPPTRLTQGDHSDRAPSFRSDGSLGFLSDRPTDSEDEGKRSQIWLLPARGGDAVVLTDEPLGVSSFRFAQAGARLAAVVSVHLDVELTELREREKDRTESGPSVLRYTDTPVRHWDHWLPATVAHLVTYDDEGNNRRDLTPTASREYAEVEWDLSRDGRFLVATEARRSSDRLDDLDLRLFDLDEHSSHVLCTGERTAFESVVFSPSGEQLACSRWRRSEKQRFDVDLCIVDRASAAVRVIADDWDRWPKPAGWSGEECLLVTCDDEGDVPVFMVDPKTGARERVTDSGAHTNLVCGEHGALALRSDFATPPLPVRLSLDDERVERLGPITAEADGLAELVCWSEHLAEADDGAPLHYWVVRPRSAGDRELPVVVWIHGGPMGAWNNQWHWRWNAPLFALQGYTMVLPNPRGSTGFGWNFTEAIWGNVWGAQCYRDVIRVVDAVAQRPDCDSSRMAAMGGSFGGYMTNWLGGQTDRFRCLVSHAGIFSFSTFHGTTDYSAWWAFGLGATPYEDFAAYDRYSPQRYVPNWRSPTLVVHGDRDYRCPIGEALSQFEGLQLHGVDSELVVFPDEGHWIQKPRNIRAWHDIIFEFLAKHLT